MLITNQAGVIPASRQTQATTARPAPSSSATEASPVTLSAQAKTSQSAAAQAVAQFESMVQQSQARPHSQNSTASGSTLGTIPSIKTFSEADVRDYEKKLMQTFEAAGIDTTQQISLTTDYEGKVVVQGDHPDKQKIEAMFAEDKDLRNGFVQTSQHYLFKELYRLNQEWARKVDAGIDIELASQWLVSSARQATAASANGLTLNEGRFRDPYVSQGTAAKVAGAYGS